MPTKSREFVPTLFVKTTDYSYHIWRTLYNNGSYTMMAKANQSSRIVLANDSVFNKRGYP